MKNRTPLPVPSEAPSAQNGHSRNPSSGFDMAARSPPNQSSKSSPGLFFFSSLKHTLFPFSDRPSVTAGLLLSMTVFAPLLTSLLSERKR
jgi:hypothetical protein